MLNEELALIFQQQNRQADQQEFYSIVDVGNQNKTIQAYHVHLRRLEGNGSNWFRFCL